MIDATEAEKEIERVADGLVAGEQGDDRASLHVLNAAMPEYHHRLVAIGSGYCLYRWRINVPGRAGGLIELTLSEVKDKARRWLREAAASTEDSE